MNRRRFLQRLTAATAAAYAGNSLPLPLALAENNPTPTPVPKLRPLEYQGVRLLPGPFADRVASARDYLLNFPEDDLLKGFRERAGLPAPGDHLGGWCQHDSGMVFGQWLSAMARFSCGADDNNPLREKALRLMNAWGRQLEALRYDHYVYEKYVGGLVDLLQYAHAPEALPLLARLTAWGEKNLPRARLDATDDDTQGGARNGQIEWYILPEHFYRAYLLTGDARYRDFADVWRYPRYWGYFNGQTKGTPDGVHAYSHCNALNGAAQAYRVTGADEHLQTVVNGAEYFLQTQCYATGGYGPGEKLMPPDGSLGRSVESPEPNERYLSGSKGRSFETPCGTWAAFKLTHSLQTLTGAARYGDWTERLLYNGIGAALPIRGRGESFYYADYRLIGARKAYFGAPFPCCAGTYFQDLAGIRDLLYYARPDGLSVNLYVPSEVAWTQDNQRVTLTQATTYPASETVSLTLTLASPQTFTLALRIPEWAGGATAQINAQPVATPAAPGAWLELRQPWRTGDQIELRLPLPTRPVPIDTQHPKRMAYARGPVVLVRPVDAPTKEMIPFQEVGENREYRMYFDI